MAHELKLIRVKAAAKKLRLTDIKVRNAVLLKAADLIIASQNKILKANAKDLELLPSTTIPSFRDRLTLNKQRLEHIALSLKQVAQLPDPLKQTVDSRKLKNGLLLKKVRSPLGVIFMIFESRPNVAIEAFSMGFKSGNAMILRGGKESKNTTIEFYKILQRALKNGHLPTDCLWGITDSDREIVNDLLTKKEFIDVVVPRGGEGLINFVVSHSTIPIIKNDRGLCHVYVHSDANLKVATAILLNAKTQRPAVCNSMETMLIHVDVANSLLPMVYEAMRVFNVKWFGCPQTLKILKKYKNINKATVKNYNTEYLDQVVNCRIVKNVNEAIAHIDTYGSGHSESIVTKNKILAKKFQNEIDAAVVYWNASTRFTDGFEFGLGGELGISTQKLHVRGPVGLLALTNERWIVDGNGQVRK